MELTFIDLFAGVGMARMGMEQAGFKCVYTCEFDKHKRKEYEIIHGNIPEGCDIRDVRATDIPRSDVWFFGAPCQDFSIAGLRKGLGGRGQALSEKSSVCSKKKQKISPSGWSMKTLKECYQAITDVTSYPYCLQWMDWGMTLNGRCLTQKISDYLRIGKECTLSDILEKEVASKYYLSQRTVDKLISWKGKSIQTLSPQDTETHCQTERTSLKVMNVNRRA